MVPKGGLEPPRPFPFSQLALLLASQHLLLFPVGL